MAMAAGAMGFGVAPPAWQARRAMWRITVAALLLALGPATALGQDGGTRPQESPESVAADVEIDPGTGERFRWVRPEEPLRRGPLPVPAWVAITGGALVATAAAAALVWRARGRRRR